MHDHVTYNLPISLPRTRWCHARDWLSPWLPKLVCGCATSVLTLCATWNLVANFSPPLTCVHRRAHDGMHAEIFSHARRVLVAPTLGQLRRRASQTNEWDVGKGPRLYPTFVSRTVFAYKRHPPRHSRRTRRACRSEASDCDTQTSHG